MSLERLALAEGRWVTVVRHSQLGACPALLCVGQIWAVIFFNVLRLSLSWPTVESCYHPLFEMKLRDEIGLLPYLVQARVTSWQHRVLLSLLAGIAQSV